MKYIDINKLNKFWEILNSKSMYISSLYGNNLSERDIFVKRVSALLKKGYILLNKEVISTNWYMNNGQPIKTRRSYVHYFKNVYYINTYNGAKIGFRDYTTMTTVVLEYIDLINLQYKYLDNNDLNIYLDYQNLLYRPLEKENVLYISKSSNIKHIKNLLNEYNLTFNKIYIKLLHKLAETNDVYIPFGNTGRYTFFFYTKKDKLFNIVNKEEYKNKSTIVEIKKSY